jgi:hypothetical protein
MREESGPIPPGDSAHDGSQVSELFGFSFEKISELVSHTASETESHMHEAGECTIKNARKITDLVLDCNWQLPALYTESAMRAAKQMQPLIPPPPHSPK